MPTTESPAIHEYSGHLADVFVRFFASPCSLVEGTLTDGSYQLLSTEHVFKDYQFSTDDQVALPE